MATPKEAAECRTREALATLIKDLCELMGEDWSIRSQPPSGIKSQINTYIAKALKIAI